MPSGFPLQKSGPGGDGVVASGVVTGVVSGVVNGLVSHSGVMMVVTVVGNGVVGIGDTPVE